MNKADEIQQVSERLWFWQCYEPEVKCDLSSSAVRTALGLVLIDPILLVESAMDELGDLQPIAVVLTSGNHHRTSSIFRERFGIPVYATDTAHRAAKDPVDHLIQDGETLFEEIDVLCMEGGGPGEIALYLPAARSLHLGDALIHLGEKGVEILPDKYCSDPKRLRKSLQKLLPLSYEVLTFAHGVPITARASERVATLLS